MGFASDHTKRKYGNNIINNDNDDDDDKKKNNNNNIKTICLVQNV